MKNLPLVASIVLAALVIGGAVMFGGSAGTPAKAQNVTKEGEAQVISILAKGGYAPKLTTAEANTPSVLRVATNGTYDCSSALRIPALQVNKVMEPTGVTEIAIPPQQPGTELKGTCAMGMYNFSVRFL